MAGLQFGDTGSSHRLRVHALGIKRSMMRAGLDADRSLELPDIRAAQIRLVLRLHNPELRSPRGSTPHHLLERGFARSPFTIFLEQTPLPPSDRGAAVSH